MGPALFLIAILGCGEADAPCQTVRTLETRYETQAACTAATEAEVAKAADVDAPVVVAQCVRAGASASVRAGEVKLPPRGSAPLKVSPLGSARRA
jgi:hypothetical protein